MTTDQLRPVSELRLSLGTWTADAKLLGDVVKIELDVQLVEP